MNINVSNIGIGNSVFGIGDQAMAGGQKVEGRKVDGQGSNDIRLSSSSSFQIADLLSGSEPVADVPESALTRDDDLGRLVASAFNLPPPAMPEFKS